MSQTTDEEVKPKIVNLTPHALTVQKTDGTLVLIPPSPPPARIAIEPATGFEVFDGIAIHEPTTYGDVRNLPAPMPKTIYVVSQLMAMELQGRGIHRSDVVFPGFTHQYNPVSDKSTGRILAVTRLVRMV